MCMSRHNTCPRKQIGKIMSALVLMRGGEAVALDGPISIVTKRCSKCAMFITR